MYITEYSDLGPKERRQLAFKRRYKAEVPAWDDSMILLTKLVAARIPEKASVLDLGCGRGNFVVDELRSRIGDIIGIDADESATTSNVSAQRVVFGDIQQRLPFADASFDCVISLWVLEHIANPDAVFAEVARVLKPGGLFAFVTPNSASVLIRARKMFHARAAKWVVKKLYGREEDDVFDVYYRANDVAALRAIAARVGMASEMLHENADPTYTAFGPITYAVSKFVSGLSGPLWKPHVIGVMRKAT